VDFLFRYKGVDWVGTILATASLYFLAKLRRSGFVLGILGNVAWIIFAVMVESPANVLSSLIYMGFNIHGWLKWKREPPKKQ
jgi:nicotinamide riboside transporter PnuC